jgi:hypothetical protein
MEKHIVLGIHITDRLKKVPEVQNLFSTYGCNIKTRLGLHEVENVCSPNGLVLLEMYGDEARCLELGEKLDQIEGIEVQKMIFTH